MNVKNLSVTQFTPEIIAETRRAWLAKATQLDMPTLDYEKELDWADRHINYAEAGNDSLAYSIIDSTDAVVAMIEVVYTRKGAPAMGWLKLLTVKLSPDFAPSEIESHPEKAEQLFNIYTCAIIGTVELTGLHRARVIKLYGRDNTLLSLLTGIKESLTRDLDSMKFKISFNARWLVIELND